MIRVVRLAELVDPAPDSARHTTQLAVVQVLRQRALLAGRQLPATFQHQEIIGTVHAGPHRGSSQSVASRSLFTIFARSACFPRRRRLRTVSSGMLKISAISATV